MIEKKFKISGNEIRKLIEPIGFCMASNHILIDGMQVGYMIREKPEFGENDSGWRFYSGLETEDYINDPKNLALYSVNTVANYDRAIIKYLRMPFGTELIRIDGTDKFMLLDSENSNQL